MSLALTSGCSVAGQFDLHRLGARLAQALGGHDRRLLAGADAESQRAESAVRGGVAVAADQRGARQGEALLRPDDMDDALIRAIQRHIGHAEFGDIGLQFGDLRARQRIGDARPRARVGTAWSATARCASGRRSCRPASRSATKLCGLLTSCRICRSI